MRKNIADIWGAARRIVPANCENPVNTYVLLYREFELTRVQKNLTLRAASDRDHIVLLDGVEICRGQFSDDPAVKTHSDIAIRELAPGRHSLLVRCYICGEKFLSYAPGQPGIILRLFNDEFELVSDAAWRGGLDPAFKSGVMPKLTSQLGFTAEVDLNKAIDYQTVGTQEFAEVKTFALDPAVDYRPRPRAGIPRLCGVKKARIIKRGVFFRRNNENSENMSPAELLQRDVVFWEAHPPQINADGTISARLDYPFYSNLPQGAVLLAKLPEEFSGFLEFTVQAPAGTVIDLAHGEHIADGRVRAHIGERNFADRFICKEGMNRFALPFRRIAAQYLELHVLLENHQSVTLHDVGINSWELPLPEPVEFTSSDPRLVAIRKRSIHTLKLCMHEHYEDCPWREQALYTYDSRNQMLYGYYLWGNWSFAAASLELWHGSQLPDGHLRLCAPSRVNSVIPIYSFIYPVQLWEHLLYSGDLACAERNFALAADILRKALKHCDPDTGLPAAANRAGWFFYEWAPELSLDGCPENEFHALYALYLLEALDAIAALARQLRRDTEEWDKPAARIRNAVDRHFYDAEQGVYFSRIASGKGFGLRHEHTQLMMLLTGSVPENRKDGVLRGLAGGSLEKITWSVMPYLARLATRKDGRFFRELLKKRLEDEYFVTLRDSDMSTVYETADGADAFEFAGSMCHGWSALPVYYTQAILLGVMPLAPGFRRFRVMPWDGGLTHASGTVPTPAGEIRVKWKRRGHALELSVTHPDELSCKIVELPETPVIRVPAAPEKTGQ